MPRIIQHALNDAQVRGLTPTAKPRDVRDGSQRGLVLTILPSGRKQWTLRYRRGGKQRRLVLGEYPGLTLSRARDEAEDVRNQVRKGADPAAERRAARVPSGSTVGSLAEDYLRKHARIFKRSAAEDQRALTIEVLPHWNDKAVKELTRRDVRALVERIADRGSPVMANRVLALIRKMLNFAVDHDWIEANPASRVARPSRESSRERVLSDEELRRLWRLLRHFPTTAEKQAPGRKRASAEPDDPLCPVSPTLAALAQVRLLTAQRGGEVARMRWRDVDLDAAWWTIPGSDTKNGEPHRVPLARQVLGIIKAQKKDGNTSEYVFVGSGESVLDRAKKAPSVIARALGIDFRGHDLRRTAATRMAAAGVPREHIARVLNHIDGGARATRVYDRHSYDREKRIALDAWARTLKNIIEGERRAHADPQHNIASGVNQSS
jgi:integrase